MVHAGRVREVPHSLRTRIEDMWNYRRNIGIVEAGSFREGSLAKDATGGGAAPVARTRGGMARDPRLHPPSAAERGTGEEDPSGRTRRFGPFEVMSEPMQCGWCRLVIPSVQSSTKMCTKTRWCRVCTKILMHLARNILRKCMNLRRIQDAELRWGHG